MRSEELALDVLTCQIWQVCISLFHRPICDRIHSVRLLLPPLCLEIPATTQGKSKTLSLCLLMHPTYGNHRKQKVDFLIIKKRLTISKAHIKGLQSESFTTQHIPEKARVNTASMANISSLPFSRRVLDLK